MIRKRKADGGDGQPNGKRKAESHDVITLKSAKSALAVQQKLIQAEESVLDTAGTAAKPNPGAFIQNDISDDSSSDEDDAYGLDPTSSQTKIPFLTESQYPKSWKRSRELIVNQALLQSPSSTRILITGSQCSGKATFAQYLAKTLLYPPKELDLSPAKSISILYLDPSKGSESFLGHVCLQILDRCSSAQGGNGYIGSKRRERNIAVGLHGQRDDTQHYVLAVAELMRELQQLSITLPMIVCCPSIERESERGIDMRSLERILALVNPDHICFTDHRTQYSAVVLEMLHARKSSASELWELEPLLERSLMGATSVGMKRGMVLQNYFNNGLSSLDALPLSSQKPYAISYRLGEQAADIGGVFVFGDLPPNHEFMISRIFNGSVVAITVAPETRTLRTLKGQGDGIPYTSDINAVDLLHTNSIGFGLIRSIDHKNGILLINTPENVARQLDNVPPQQVLLVHGIAGTPEWAFAQDVVAGLEPCYLGSARRGMQTVKSRRFKKKG